MPKILAISDTHGFLPDVPECDILLIGGDITPNFDHALDYQHVWLDHKFRDWLASLPAKHIVGIAGNHDFIFERRQQVDALDLPWTYLQDSGTIIDGVSIWGTPWVPNLRRWAFYGGASRVEDHFEKIPDDTDIILSHGPMHGYGDVVSPMFGGPKHVGCLSMAEQVKRIQPKAFVCGHIHEARGHYRHDSIEHGIFNVSYLDETYSPQGEAVELPFT